MDYVEGLTKNERECFEDAGQPQLQLDAEQEDDVLDTGLDTLECSKMTSMTYQISVSPLLDWCISSSVAGAAAEKLAISWSSSLIAQKIFAAFYRPPVPTMVKNRLPMRFKSWS